MGSTIDQIKEKIFSKYKKDNWEIKTLGEITREIISGNEVTREQLGTGEYPAVKCGDINSSLPQQFKECISFVDLNLIKKPKYFEFGDVLISKMSNKVETVGTVAVYLGEEKCLAGGDIDILKHGQNSKFLAYVLSSRFVRKQIENLSQESTVYHLYTKKIKQIKIPLPPLEIQNEIVEFLDKFTELEGELERELEKRKQQYEYYKELIFNRGIEELNWDIRFLKEIIKDLYLGNGIKREQINTGNYPAISYKNIFDSCIQITENNIFVDEKLISNKKYVQKEDLLIAVASNIEETLGKSCAYLGEEKCIVGNNINVLKHNQNSKYLSYSMSTKYVKKQIKELSQRSTVFRLYPRDIKQLKVPIPPLEEQAKVVETLDKLYSITNDLKEGIPMLIQKNREQYNFYKELLLEK